MLLKHHWAPWLQLLFIPKNHAKFSSSLFLKLLCNGPEFPLHLNERNLSGYTCCGFYSAIWASRIFYFLSSWCRTQVPGVLWFVAIHPQSLQRASSSMSLANSQSLFTPLKSRDGESLFAHANEKAKQQQVWPPFSPGGKKKKMLLTSVSSIPWFVGYFLPLIENAETPWVLQAALINEALFSLLNGTTVTCSGCSEKAQH